MSAHPLSAVAIALCGLVLLQPSTPEMEQDRFLAHISLDKPIYRAGETIFIRAAVLHAIRHTPASFPLNARVKILGPGGGEVFETACWTEDSVLGAAWAVPPGQAGGQYVLRMVFPRHGFPAAEREFEIRAYRPPRLNTEIQFLRKGYGPSDRVTAFLEAERAEGGAPANAKVTVVARIDGKEVHRGEACLDTAGRCSVSFRLPDSIAKGEGTLSLVIDDGGVVETAAKTIPILLQTLQVDLYPEGGDLVAGLPCGIYLEARTPWGDPADLKGQIIDETGAVAAYISTDHEGRGRTGLIPRAGMRYSLSILEPSGITGTFPLPEVKEEGVALRAVRDAYAPGADIVLEVSATRAGPYRIALSRRDQVGAVKEIDLAAGEVRRISIDPGDDAEGVIRATVMDVYGRGLAERLVFRRPREGLGIEITADRDHYTPGGQAVITIRTTAPDGTPIPALVGITVTDDAVLQMMDRREQAPRLPAMAHLESEVNRLEDAWIYLSDDPKADGAVDLLLGTQGWRRFAFLDPEEFVARHEDKAREILALLDRPVELPKGDGRQALLWKEAEMGAVRAPAAPDALVGEMIAEEKGFRDLRRAGKKRVMLQFRVYAHQVRADRTPGDRRDFTETLYWNAGVRTGEDGTATIRFDLSDSVTTFRILVDGFTGSGLLGSADHLMDSREPFYLEPKLPLEVTSGDRILLPVSLVNGTLEDLRVKMGATAGPALELPDSLANEFPLEADGRDRMVLPISVGHHDGETTLTLEGVAGDLADRVTRQIRVVPHGFPVRQAFGDVLEKVAFHDITIPAGVQPSSIHARAVVYPTPLASLTEALQALLREPHGCFEQTSSTNYPVIMAQRYFTSHGGVSPDLVGRARDLLEKGYKKLVGFECAQKGYEWFGGDPGHEALTAYGVLEFVDMAAVFPVDTEMLQRTRAWLLDRRDGKGGFLRNSRALDSFGRAPGEITNAYIVWALVQAGETDLDREIATLVKQADTSDDPYFLGLVAGSLYKLGRKDDAGSIARKILPKQGEDGGVDGASTSITRSGGEALRIEATSLAILAWLNDPSFTEATEKAIRWLAGMCKGGRFGSTQSTVLALRAILAYDAARAAPRTGGSLVLLVDGGAVGTVPFDHETQGAIELPSFADRLTPGDHRVEIRMEGGSVMPYSLEIGYHTSRLADSPDGVVGLEVGLSTAEIREGETTEVQVCMRNLTGEGQPMAVALIGLPGGLEVRHDQLKELVGAGTIDYYEVIGRDVVIYQRDLEPNEEIRFPIDTVAAVPGDYTGAASRAYLYYTDEAKRWADGLKIHITPRL